jgi:mannose-6-phosphate isomerase-like protein (cupin superfamily)
VYVILEGSARLEAGDEHWDLASGTCVRVGPGEKRRIVPGERGVTILALGGTPGRSYQRPEWMK